jgi:hypothetical protein
MMGSHPIGRGEPMPQKQDLVALARHELEFLCSDHGFEHPTVVAHIFQSSPLCRRGQIGIEVEFDWREEQVFVLVVRLEDGQLPTGYVYGGMQVRVHLPTMIRDRHWKIIPEVRSPRRRSPSMAEQVADYKQMIAAYAGRIIDEADRLFR